MANEITEHLREMAAHRGFKLVSSRRRKPGGDFGLYGLKDPAGKPVFGIDGDTLIADAAAIEEYLRGSASSAWQASAGSVKARRKPKAKSAPKPRLNPKPKPRFKVEVANLLVRLPAAKREEAFTQLFARGNVRVERIVSRGQSTPEDAPMVQDADEWVALLEGAAGIRIEDSEEVTLSPGDYLWIERGRKHWVTWTAKDRPSVWLAMHFE